MFYLSDSEMCDGGSFIMLCGAPGSGKSTKARELASTLPGNWVVVSSDDIRTELFGTRKDQNHNKEVFNEAHKRIKANLDLKFNVIFDATNCNSRFRKYAISWAKKSNNYGRSVCMIMHTSLLDCVKNNQTRDESMYVPEEVIERMYMQLKSNPPTMNEGYDIIAFSR